MDKRSLSLIENVDMERVAHILNRVTSSKPDELVHCGGVTAGMYYEALSDIADTITYVRDIFNNIPEELVAAAGMSFSIEYRDAVINGTIKAKGGLEREG